MKQNQFSKTHLMLTVIGFIAVTYLFWSGYFIYKSSFITADGNRSYSLFDDAMISMRYGLNLASGNGLVWNPGERVEGFTNLGMTLYMALGALFFGKMYGILFVQISCGLFMLLLAFVCFKIGETYLKSTNSGHHLLFLPLFFIAGLAYYPLQYWTLMGMENGLESLFLYAGIFLAIKYDKRPTFVPLLPLFLGIAYVTRPDALVPSFVVMSFRLFGLFRKPEWIKIILKETLILFAIYVAVALFRYSYYHEWVPNTYTLKVTGHPMGPRLTSGFRYIKEFWWSPAFAGAVVCILGYFFRPNRMKFLFLTIIAAATAYQINVGGDVFAMFRMISNFVPLFTILLVCVLSDLAQAVPTKLVWNTAGKVFAVFSFCAFLYVLNMKFMPEVKFDKLARDVAANKSHANMGLALKELLKPDATIAVFWAGTMPYYSDLTSIDMLGKCDKHIAHLDPIIPNLGNGNKRYSPGHIKYDLKYSIIKLKPTFIQGYSWKTQSIKAYAEKHYKKISFKGFSFWIRKDSDDVNWNLTKSSPRF